MTDAAAKHRPIPVVALLLSWLVPGAGHMYLGRMRRGVVLLVTIAALFWAGVAMGGVMTVDYHAERWWFIADMFTGIHGLVGYHRQKQVYRQIEREVSMGAGASGEMAVDQWLKDKGIALVHPVDNVARAYAGIAGLLNLLCIFDATILALMGRFGEPPPPSPTAGRQP